MQDSPWISQIVRWMLTKDVLRDQPSARQTVRQLLSGPKMVMGMTFRWVHKRIMWHLDSLQTRKWYVHNCWSVKSQLIHWMREWKGFGERSGSYMIISGQSVELFISDIILHNVAACERQTSLRHLYNVIQCKRQKGVQYHSYLS